VSYKVEPEMSEPLPDHQLIESILLQQAWAFEMLYERYRTTIYRHILHIICDNPDPG
jgi:hypothetical protein